MFGFGHAVLLGSKKPIGWEAVSLTHEGAEGKSFPLEAERLDRWKEIRYSIDRAHRSGGPKNGRIRVENHPGKAAAGRRAADEVADGMTLGLGTGSTVHFLLVRLGERIAREGIRVRGVPTSDGTAEEACRQGISLIDLNQVDELDLYLDGADEVDPRFQLIKGAGGALLREKVVALASRVRVIVVDRSKLVGKIGRKAPVPIEVIPFARSSVERAVVDLGGNPRLRVDPGGEPFRTSGGNEILDCRFPGGIEDAPALERSLSRIVGAVENGLFIGLADRVVIGGEKGDVEVRERSS